MKRLIISGALAASSALMSLSAGAAINGVDAESYLQRGIAMYADKNFDGCIDQLLQIRQLDPVIAAGEQTSYYMAMASLYTGDDEAADLLQRFLHKFPQSPFTQEVTAALGDFYFTRGSYGEALNVYGRVAPDALTADRCEDLIYRMAYCHMLLGETKKASELFDRLRATKRYGNAALFYKAYIAYYNHDYIEARRLFSEVDTRREPGQAAAYYLCQLNFHDGRWEAAFSDARELLRRGEVKEFEPELKRIAGESAYNLGRVEDALTYLRQYVDEAAEPMSSAFYILGVDDYESGNYEGAKVVLQRAVGDSDATGQGAYLYLGKCYAKTGDANAATMAFEKASKLNFDPVMTETATYDYIASLMDGGRTPFGSSVGMMENFLKRYPHSSYASAIRESLVNGYMSDSDYENALRIINASGKHLSKEMTTAKQTVLLLLGNRDFENGRLDNALARFNEGAALSGGDAGVRNQCRLMAGNCHYELEQYAEAAADYRRFIADAPKTDANRAIANYNLGYSLLQLEDYAAALTCFNAVASDKSVAVTTRADALNRAGDCYYCQREFAKAANLYKQAYDTNPSAGDYALFQQAEMAGLNRDYNSRISILDRMLEQFPQSPLVPRALMAKAESYNVTGRAANANEIYRTIVARYPATAQSRQALIQLAMNCLNAGDTDAAVDAYKSVVTRYPSSSESRVALDDLKNIYASQGRLPEYVEWVNSTSDAPRIEMSQLEATAFATAAEQYLDNQSTRLLLDYLKQYPDGANLPQALLYLAEDAEERRDNTAAYGYACRIVEKYPDSDQAERALLIKADGEAADGRLEMAYDTYLNLSRRASSAEMLTDARTGLLMAAIDLGRYGDALDTSEQLLATSATNTDRTRVLFLRGLAFDRIGRSDEAYEIWSELAKQPATLNGSKSAVYMIESLTAKGRLDQAEEMANAFIDAGSPHNYWYARGFIAYSDVLRAKGKDFEADEYLKALKANYPGQESEIFEMIESRLR